MVKKRRQPVELTLSEEQLPLELRPGLREARRRAQILLTGDQDLSDAGTLVHELTHVDKWLRLRDFADVSEGDPTEATMDFWDMITDDHGRN